jgi:hypothetical protein
VPRPVTLTLDACEINDDCFVLHRTMKNLSRFILYVFVSILIVTLSKPSYACVCRGVQQPPCFAFQEATAVFAGEVVDISEVPFQQGETFHCLLIQFSVEESFKGISTPQVRVATITGTDCDFGFQKGKEYFVYAYQDPRHNRLATGVCTRTKELIDAQEDMNHVKGTNASAPRTLLLGADSEFSSPLKGSEIIVEGQGKQYKTIADKRGAFRIELAQAGKYKVTVIGRPGAVFLNHLDSWRIYSAKGRPVVEFEKEIREGRCDFVDFSEHLTVKER